MTYEEIAVLLKELGESERWSLAKGRCLTVRGREIVRVISGQRVFFVPHSPWLHRPLAECNTYSDCRCGWLFDQAVKTYSRKKFVAWLRSKADRTVGYAWHYQGYPIYLFDQDEYRKSTGRQPPQRTDWVEDGAEPLGHTFLRYFELSGRNVLAFLAQRAKLKKRLTALKKQELLGSQPSVPSV